MFTSHSGFVQKLSFSLLALSAVARPVSAAPGPRERCATSFEQAQQERNRGKLLRARELLLSCARSSCGPVMVRECTALLDEVKSQIPSVIFALSDARGTALERVQVRVDDKLVASRLDGRAVNVDPGVHRVSMTAADGQRIEQQVTIAQGTQNRGLSFKLEPARVDAAATAVVHEPSPGPKAADESRSPVAAEAAQAVPVDAAPSPRSSALPYVFLGVGAAGVAGFAVLGSVGGAQERQLQACWPRCGEARVQSVRTLYLAADASLGVGVAALATGLVLVLVGSPARDEQDRGRSRASASYSIGLRPSLGGVFADVSGAF